MNNRFVNDGPQRLARSLDAHRESLRVEAEVIQEFAPLIESAGALERLRLRLLRRRETRRRLRALTLNSPYINWLGRR